MIYIGIDPGLAGGIAALTDGGHVLGVYAMPNTARDLSDCLKAILSHRSVEGAAMIVLERVSSSPQMGVVSAFTFGKGFGRIEGVLAALELEPEYVVPVKWQEAIGCRSYGDKNITKRRAQALFPHEKITHAKADALLLAEYLRRIDRGHQAATNKAGAHSDGKKAGKQETAGEQEPTQRSAKRFGSTQGGRGI